MKRIWGASLCVLVLAGCGGGGGGSSSATAPAATTVSGVAAKGLVKQAKVLVCRIVNGAPEADASCASGTTGSDGSYSVTLADGFMGPVMVKIMAAAGSTMVDETTGSDIPYNMTMRAVVPAVSATTTAHVTPFTEMAANGMALSGSMDATRISQAIAAVQNFMTTLGIDMSVMPMVDLKNDASDSVKLGMESNMAEQLSRVAMAAKNSSVLKDSNGVPCSAGATASQQFACAVTAMASVMTSYVGDDPTKMADLITALKAQNVTAVQMPIRTASGTIAMEPVDMTSSASMQAALQQAGMTASTAAGTANVMMGQMH